MYYSIYMCNNRNGMGKLYLVEHIFKYLLLGIEGLACGTPWATAANLCTIRFRAMDDEMSGLPDPPTLNLKVSVRQACTVVSDAETQTGT